MRCNGNIARGLEVRERLAAEYPHVLEYRRELTRSHNRQDILLVGWGRAPRQNGNRQSYRDNLVTLSTSVLVLDDHAAAAAAARKFVELDFDPICDRYIAACFFSRWVPLAEKDTKLSEAMRKELVKTYADQAMDFLRQAAAKATKTPPT